jgi:hypothetical protein
MMKFTLLVYYFLKLRFLKFEEMHIGFIHVYHSRTFIGCSQGNIQILVTDLECNAWTVFLHYMTTTKSTIRRLSNTSHIISFILGMPIIVGVEKADALKGNWNIYFI